MLLTFLRIQNKSISYLIINLLKVNILLLLIIYSIYNKLEFNQYLYYQIVIIWDFCFVDCLNSIYFDSNQYEAIALYSVLLFAISQFLM